MMPASLDGAAPAWRGMRGTDLPAILKVAERVHPDHPEDARVFAERLALSPEGCRVLAGEGAVLGDLIGHPGVLGQPPELNGRLGRLPATPSTHSLHDLALLPEARGGGHAGRIVAAEAGRARRGGVPSLSLIAVGGSAPFWARHGFREAPERVQAGKLASYGAGARFMMRPLDARERHRGLPRGGGGPT